MKYRLLALLNDRPDDIEWDNGVLDVNHPAVVWCREYKDTYGSLPTLELFAQECLDEGEKPIPIATWDYYCREAADMRFVEEANKHIADFNDTYVNDPKRAILHLRDAFLKLNEPKKTLAAVDIAERTEERWKKFGLKQANRIKTGIKPFDEAAGGVSPDDEFMILSARLGIGKSFILHYVALEMAKQGLNVGIYSGEMSEDEVGSRIDTWLTHVSNFELTRGKATGVDKQVEAYREQVKGKIFVITPKQIGRNATPTDMRKFCKEYNLSVLCIDQLSLMQPDGRQSSEMNQQFANLSLQLKSLQQELRLPIIAVSQLNRQAQQEEINAANISGSDRIGQDATIVLAIERKDKEMTLKVLKARSFKRPEKGWSFSWNIDEGVLTPLETALDKVQARTEAAKSQDALSAVKQEQQKQEQQAQEVPEGYFDDDEGE